MKERNLFLYNRDGRHSNHLHYLLHSLDDLSEDQQILAAIDHTVISLRRDEIATFLGVSSMQELFKRLT